MTKNPNETTGVVQYDDAWAKENMRRGMRGVDPMDIIPPQILLVQKSSKLSAMRTADGRTPVPGQFFHTGRNVILMAFDAYFIFAAKGKFKNRRKAGEPIEDQYVTIGYMVDDMSIFGYKLRGSALRSLSPLFTAVVAQNRPMFSFRCNVSIKQLENKDGEWWVPVVNVGPVEQDKNRLAELEFYADQYEQKTEPHVEVEEETVPAAVVVEEDTSTPPPDGKEDVKPDDISF